MNRTIILALGTALCAAALAPAALQAQTKAPATPAASAPKAAVRAAPAKASAYRAPRNAFGQPDLGGAWTNASITTEQRPANVNGRAVYTPQEVAELEGFVAKEVEVGNKVSDPTKGAPTKGGDPIPEGIRTSLYLGGGGNTGGYDRGWLDPGSAVMRVGGEPRTSFITTTANGRIPPAIPKAGSGAGRAAQAQREADDAAGENAVQRAGAMDNPELRPAAERCLAFGNTAGPMLPNGYYNNNIRIVQGKDSVAIWLEMVHDVRIVRIGGKHRTDGVKPWFGDSIGHWEGDTLVVETTNYHPSTSFQGSDGNLKLTEKFTRVGRDRLLYQFTIDDPTVWATSWGGEYEFYPTQGGGLFEYACHEGNYGLENVLAGAREAERAAAQGKSAAR